MVGERTPLDSSAPSLRSPRNLSVEFWRVILGAEDGRDGGHGSWPIPQMARCFRRQVSEKTDLR